MMLAAVTHRSELEWAIAQAGSAAPGRRSPGCGRAVVLIAPTGGLPLGDYLVPAAFAIPLLRCMRLSLDLTLSPMVGDPT